MQPGCRGRLPCARSARLQRRPVRTSRSSSRHANAGASASSFADHASTVRTRPARRPATSGIEPRRPLRSRSGHHDLRPEQRTRTSPAVFSTSAVRHGIGNSRGRSAATTRSRRGLAAPADRRRRDRPGRLRSRDPTCVRQRPRPTVDCSRSTARGLIVTVGDGGTSTAGSSRSSTTRTRQHADRASSTRTAIGPAGEDRRLPQTRRSAAPCFTWDRRDRHGDDLHDPQRLVHASCTSRQSTPSQRPARSRTDRRDRHPFARTAPGPPARGGPASSSRPSVAHHRREVR